MARVAPEWSIEINNHGYITRKGMRGPLTPEAAKAEMERQQKVISRKTGLPMMPPGEVTVTARNPDTPRPAHVGAPLAVQLAPYVRDIDEDDDD